MRIAILGTRGIPANYGGFETFAEELSLRLVQRGHSTTVFCRSHYVDSRMTGYRGVRLIVLPTVRSKHLDTVCHAFLSTVRSLRMNFDVVLVCNAANSFSCALLKLARIPSVLNVDGIERKRKKWGWAGKFHYWISEMLAVRTATCLVSDARVIQEYYRRVHLTDSFFIPYGSSVPEVADRTALDKHRLAPGGYFLYVSRLEPENNAHVAIGAHATSGTRIPLLVVGDAPYALKYKASLAQMATSDVRFAGAVYGSAYHGLQAHALAYIQATEVGGTHPALVEALGHGNLILANDTPENREVLGAAGLYYRRNDSASLAELMRAAESDPALKAGFGPQACRRARELYNWEDVTESYLEVFREARRRSGIFGKRGLGNGIVSTRNGPKPRD